MIQMLIESRQLLTRVKSPTKINYTFNIHFSTNSSVQDLSQKQLIKPALIASTAKFGSIGQLASLQCQLSFPEAACSILRAWSEPVKVQSTGYI